MKTRIQKSFNEDIAVPVLYFIDIHDVTETLDSFLVFLFQAAHVSCSFKNANQHP